MTFGDVTDAFKNLTVPIGTPLVASWRDHCSTSGAMCPEEIRARTSHFRPMLRGPELLPLRRPVRRRDLRGWDDSAHALSRRGTPGRRSRAAVARGSFRCSYPPLPTIPPPRRTGQPGMSCETSKIHSSVHSPTPTRSPAALIVTCSGTYPVLAPSHRWRSSAPATSCKKTAVPSWLQRWPTPRR